MSRLPFELFLALRYLRPKRTFVSVITLVSVCGVLLGVAVLPLLWGRAGAFTARLHSSLPPYLVQLNASGHLPAGVQFFNYPVKSEYQGTTGHALEAGGYGAQAPANPAGN